MYGELGLTSELMYSTTAMPGTRIFSSLKPRARRKKGQSSGPPTEGPPSLRLSNAHVPHCSGADRPSRWDVPPRG